MEAAIKRMVQKAYPELAGGYHLPRFAEVVGARETPKGGEICDEFRPVMAVDIQVLTEHGEPDEKFPVLKDVALPGQGSGHESGTGSFPENGTWVEIGFAYGSPNKPFIRCILPHGRSQIPIERGELRTQHSAQSYQTIDKDGNHQRITDGTMSDSSLKKTSTATEHDDHFGVSTIIVDTNATETIGGIKKLLANMGMEMMSGERFDIGAVGDLNSISKTKVHSIAPKHWVGSTNENVLKQLSELMDLVMTLCTVLSTHTHSGVQSGGGNTAAPVQASNINAVKTNTNAVKVRLDGITETTPLV
ncbi:hypothetical protein [Methylobacter sp. S3L5C]|uniref:hypothetical protein n=1 Tax=Methylobacter sp. S3L5C TaxID=2839024 RepID=UPI001FAD9941|nr:hypothetical protein [Methylobacter sp. S3L5C]UOA08623.1 hypothetical protein KKZ03_20940 [Methylobacter sp. S3L5C]